jgi:hypothetical protein
MRVKAGGGLEHVGRIRLHRQMLKVKMTLRKSIYSAYTKRWSQPLTGPLKLSSVNLTGEISILAQRSSAEMLGLLPVKASS